MHFPKHFPTASDCLIEEKVFLRILHPFKIHFYLHAQVFSHWLNVASFSQTFPHCLRVSLKCPPYIAVVLTGSTFCQLQIQLSLWLDKYFNTGSVRIAGGWTPLPHLADPPTSGQNSTLGGRVSTPHLSFPEVGMLLDSHFLLMQFLKYLQHDDLNVTTILIHIED